MAAGSGLAVVIWRGAPWVSTKSTPHTLPLVLPLSVDAPVATFCAVNTAPAWVAVTVYADVDGTLARAKMPFALVVVV